jgi:hypothetical protein
MLVHAVYFWLKDDLSDDDRRTFTELIQTLKTIEDVEAGYLGPPADTDRPVIDRSYSYAEVLIFKDRSAHDRYQVHPTHRHFVNRCASFWTRVVIYDSLG